MIQKNTLQNLWLLLAFLFLIAVGLNALSGRYVQYQSFSSQGFLILDTWTGEVHVKTSHSIDLPDLPNVPIPEPDKHPPLKEQ